MPKQPSRKTAGWHNNIRRCGALAVSLAILGCTAASCGPEKTEQTVVGPHCAFADPECTTLLGICEVVARYYLAHHEWPEAKPQLEEQWNSMLDQEKEKMPAEEVKEAAGFFDRFTLIDLRKKGDNLRCHFRFKIENKSFERKFTLRPGLTADEIMSSST